MHNTDSSFDTISLSRPSSTKTRGSPDNQEMPLSSEAGSLVLETSSQAMSGSAQAGIGGKETTVSGNLPSRYEDGCVRCS